MTRVQHEDFVSGFHESLILHFLNPHLSNTMELVDYIVAIQKVKGMLHQIRLIVVCLEYFHLLLVDCVPLPCMHYLVQKRKFHNDFSTFLLLALVVLG